MGKLIKSLTGHERKESSAEFAQRHYGRYCEYQANDSDHDGAGILVHCRAGLCENLHCIESDCVNAAELIDHEVREEDQEGFVRGWSEHGLDGLHGRHFTRLRKQEN